MVKMVHFCHQQVVSQQHDDVTIFDVDTNLQGPRRTRVLSVPTEVWSFYHV